MIGHVGATLATEIPVGLSVAAGQLPATSLHRLACWPVVRPWAALTQVSRVRER